MAKGDVACCIEEQAPHQEKDLGSKAPQVNPYFSGLNKYSQSYVGIDQVSL